MQGPSLELSVSTSSQVIVDTCAAAAAADDDDDDDHGTVAADDHVTVIAPRLASLVRIRAQVQNHEPLSILFPLPPPLPAITLICTRSNSTSNRVQPTAAAAPPPVRGGGSRHDARGM